MAIVLKTLERITKVEFATLLLWQFKFDVGIQRDALYLSGSCISFSYNLNSH